MSDEITKEESTTSQTEGLLDDSSNKKETELLENDYPETPASAPTHDYHVVNKKYVDDNSGIDVLAADPAGAVEGDIYFNSDTKRFRGYDGTTWYNLGWTEDIPVTGAPIDLFYIYVYEGAAKIYAYGGGIATIVTPLAPGYHLYEVSWDAANNRARARIDGGSWSGWVYPTIGWTGINGLKINNPYVGDGYWDNFSGDLVTNTIEALDVGALDGQGGWTGPSDYLVSETNPYAGTQCIYSPKSLAGIEIPVTLVATGTQSVYASHASNDAGKGLYAMILLV